MNIYDDSKYRDRRISSAYQAMQYLLEKHRDELMQKDNERRRKLKEQLK